MRRFGGVKFREVFVSFKIRGNVFIVGFSDFSCLDIVGWFLGIYLEVVGKLGFIVY